MWVRSQEVWWPAKVLDAKEAELMSGQPMPIDQHYAVMFYGPEYTLGYAVAADVEAFENSSGKAVTSDPILKAAIKDAAEDASANPLRVIAQPSSKRAADDRSKVPEDRRVAKRGRNDLGNAIDDHRRNDDDMDDSYPKSLPRTYRFESVATLMDIEKRLRAANEQGDMSAARKQLLRLDRVKITRDMLETTKIGVAIGNVLGIQKFEKLWALARALINWFILALPKVTLQAIQEFHEVHAAAQTDLDVAKETISAAAAAATGRGNQGGSALATRSATSFRTLDKVIAVFQADPNVGFDVTPVVEGFFVALQSSDAKRMFLSQLVKPGHVHLRKRILDGSITAEDFGKLPPAAFVTDAEKNAEDAKIRAIIEAQEEEDKINAVGTTMFECPNCKKKNATYHEQQTRGADEPTTKFVKCIECKHNWTTE